MASMKSILAQLDLGKSVAEFDDELEKYFVETGTFRALIEDKIDIVAGDKGTGKTAIFRILQKRQKNYYVLRDIEFLPAFNPQGNPVFLKLAETDILPEGEYVKIWKAYILSLAGNWILSALDGVGGDLFEKLDNLLQGLDLREKANTPQNIFYRTIAKIGSLFRWKSASMEISTDPAGNATFTPKIEFNDERKAPLQELETAVSIESALQLLDSCVEEAGITLWIAFDRLDEAFQGFPNKEVPALRALFRSYLDLLEFKHIRLKLFVRRDLFRRITEGGFVNLTHVNARKIEVIWDEEDLLNLLCRRIRENKSFLQALGIEDCSDRQVFDRLFPPQVDFGKRKPQTWTWIMRRVRDGNDIKPPRNLIDLITFSQQAQLRREERESRSLETQAPVIEADSLRRALIQLSETRVQDTLLAEAGSYANAIEQFRNGKAEHNHVSLAELFGDENGKLRNIIKPLVDMGFLEDIKGTYKIPSLYREGLSITQGKAFDALPTDPSLIEQDDD